MAACGRSFASSRAIAEVRAGAARTSDRAIEAKATGRAPLGRERRLWLSAGRGWGRRAQLRAREKGGDFMGFWNAVDRDGRLRQDAGDRLKIVA